MISQCYISFSIFLLIENKKTLSLDKKGVVLAHLHMLQFVAVEYSAYLIQFYKGGHYGNWFKIKKSSNGSKINARGSC